MTVLPTVRHQLYRAAAAQAGGRATTGGHRRRRVTAGAVVPLGLGWRSPSRCSRSCF